MTGHGSSGNHSPTNWGLAPRLVYSPLQLGKGLGVVQFGAGTNRIIK